GQPQHDAPPRSLRRERAADPAPHPDQGQGEAPRVARKPHGAGAGRRMRAMGMRAFGGPEVLEMLDAPKPEPGAGQVRVKVAVAGINFMDVYMRGGAYAKSHVYPTPLPFVLGMEGAGTVDAVGAGAGDFGPGERVAWCISPGAYAEFAVVPAWKLVRVP